MLSAIGQTEHRQALAMRLDRLWDAIPFRPYHARQFRYVVDVQHLCPLLHLIPVLPPIAWDIDIKQHKPRVLLPVGQILHLTVDLAIQQDRATV